MSSSLLNKAGKALFEKHLEQYSPQDPMYEEYTDKKGKKKRRRRQVPPGLSARDTKILKSVQRRAHYLDKGFSICGFRFGWTFVVGIIPGAGDVGDIVLNYYLVVRKARQADIPGWLVRRMLINNAISAGVGLVPVAGDFVLAIYKANSRNAALLEEYLRIRGEEFIKREEKKAQPKKTEGGKDNTGISELDREQFKPASGEEDVDVIEGTPSSTTRPKKQTGSFLRWRPSTKKAKTEMKEDEGALPTTVEETPVRESTRGDRGKFVEDITPPTEEMAPSGSGMLKKKSASASAIQSPGSSGA